jgi:hypothetical protein
MDNTEKLEKFGTQGTKRRQIKQKAQHMCWTPLCENKRTHKTGDRTSADMIVEEHTIR